MVIVREATAEDVDGAVRVLQGLPDYFTPNTHDELRAGLGQHAGWVATLDDGENDVIGVVLAERRYARTAEITYAAVVREHQGTGVGTRLVDAAVAALAAEGVQVVEVKTLDASAGYAPYEATRAFWERRGFHQIDCIDPLPGWQPGNPSAIYVAALRATR